MARLSAAEARALGISAQKPKDKKAKKPARGRNREPREAVNAESIEFTVQLPFDPRPKERPRTVAGLDRLRKIYQGAAGSAPAFTRMAGAALDRAYRQSAGNFEAFLKGLGGGSRTYTPKATVDYETLIAHAATKAMGSRPPLTCAVETHIHIALRGDSATWPTSRLDGDADNLEKAILDALNGIVFDDDRLVVRSTREKCCADHPYIKVRVGPAAP